MRRSHVGAALGATALAVAVALTGCSAASESSSARGLGASSSASWSPTLPTEPPPPELPSALASAAQVEPSGTPEQAALSACGDLGGVVGPITGAEAQGASLASQPEIVSLLSQAAAWAAYAADSDPTYGEISSGAAQASTVVSSGFMSEAAALTSALGACLTVFPNQAAAGGWADAQAQLQEVVSFEEEFGD